MREKVIGVITARMSSQRLPGKVMKDLAGKSVFAHHVERLRGVESLDGVYLATSFERDDNLSLIEEAERLGVPFYEGEKEDVLERHEKIIEMTGAAAVIRVTCDMPLFDIPTIDQYIEVFHASHPDYVFPGNFNSLAGTMCELISSEAIRKSHRFYRGPALAKYIVENPGEFKMVGVNIRNDICRPDVRLDLDYPEDLELIRRIYDGLYKDKPIHLEEVYRFLDDNPSLVLINRFRVHKECNLFAHRLLYNPVFQVVKSGERFEILDESGQPVEYKKFLKEIARIFDSESK